MQDCPSFKAAFLILPGKGNSLTHSMLRRSTCRYSLPVGSYNIDDTRYMQGMVVPAHPRSPHIFERPNCHHSDDCIGAGTGTIRRRVSASTSPASSDIATVFFLLFCHLRPVTPLSAFTAAIPPSLTQHAAKMSARVLFSSA